jgi:protein O-GlcNAc transferase
MQVVLVQLTDSPDAESARVEAMADEVVRVPVSPTLPAAAAVRAAALDVLLYPELGMDRRLLRLAALRLAPLQLVAWGHPVTTGLPTIDGFLSSADMEPPDGDTHYTEHLIRLPGLGAQPLLPRPGAPVRDRAALGLDPDAAVLLVPQSPFKLLPQHDHLLARCVRAAIAAGARPQLVLLASELAQASRGVKDTLLMRLAAAFRAEGLQVEAYLRLLPGLGAEDYLALNQHADLFLDAPGWSGGRTTLEALRCGLVPITLPGPLMRQRHTAAILTRCGHTETIAQDADQFVDLVGALLREPARRRALGSALQQAVDAIANDETSIDALADVLRNPQAWGLAPRTSSRSLGERAARHAAPSRSAGS